MTQPAGQPWSIQFRRERQATWLELEQLVARAEAGTLHAQSTDKISRLPTLYRATVSALSVARASVLDRGLLDYLETLTARAYLVVYAPQRSLGQTLLHFLTTGFPVAVRSISRQVAVSAALLLLGVAIAYGMVRANLDDYHLFVDQGMAQGRDPGASTAELERTLFHHDGEAGLLTFATFLFTHNSSIGILTFGLGLLFGLPVTLLLFYNGMMLGAMTALFHDRGLAVAWWSWILPHGITELLAIVLCGAAGLAIDQRIVFATRHSRWHELAIVGRSMGAVVAGAVLMLLLAGFIEGIFRQVVHNLGLRYTLAIASALAWLAYFRFAGRSSA